MNKRVFILFGFLLLLGMSSIFLSGQETTGSLTGRVVDETGAGLPGVSIIINSPALVAKDLTISTNESGWYIVRALPPGTYAMKASLQGFDTLERTGIIVEQARQFRVDFALKMGKMEKTISVVATAPMVDTVKPSISQTLDTNFLENLPATTQGRRQYSEIIRTLPGVTDDSREGMGGSPMIYGNRKFDVGFRIEGIQTNDLSYGWFAGFVPMDALEDIQVKGTAISAEHGWNQGGIVSMRFKEGSNEFHGSISDYYSNNHLWGNTALKRTDNQATFTLGGPIKRDKVWFFLSYENGYGSGEIFGRTDGIEAVNHDPQIVAKVTAQLNPKNRLSVNYYSSRTKRYDYSYNSADYPPETMADTGYYNDSLGFDLVTTLSDKFFLESHFDYRKFERYMTFGGNNPFIETYSDIFSALPNGWRAQGQPNGDHDWYNQYEAKMKLSAFLEGQGRHDVVLGWDLYRWDAKLQIDTRTQYYIYDDPYVPGGIAVESSTPLPRQNPYKNKITSFAVFANDDWIISDWLTANLGLRFGAEIFYRTNYHVEPRLGVNLSPFGDIKSRIRASFSRFYGAIYLRNISLDQRSSTRSQIFLFDPNAPTYTGELLSTYVMADSEAINNPGLKTPYTDELAISYERELTKDISASVAYVKRWQKDQFVVGDANVDINTGQYIGDTSHPEIMNLGKGSYDGLQVVLKKRYSHKYQWEVSYNWSRSRNTADNAYLYYIPYPPNQFASRYGIGDDDKPHFIKASFSALLPLDIQVAGFYSFRSGRPYSKYNMAYYGSLTPFVSEFIGTRNQYRLKDFHDLSVHFEKVFYLKRVHTGLIGEVMNVFNDKTVTRVYTSGARFGLARNARLGRRYQLGLRLQF